MSAVHGIAWGLVDADEVAKNFQHWRREVRRELRTHRICLIGLHSGYYQLRQKTKQSGHKRVACYTPENFVECCKRASKLITPSNHETTE